MSAENELCNHILGVMRGRFSGASEKTVCDNRPSAVFFVGNLAQTPKL